ncbi:MAG TPA: carotenoid oxygenase family protein [Stackebrandtia sp.]|jgi:carotenoid cleavage dioxygenase|uniref:carotenoid oxygenase family protein n=1 Tax=Stackebrandtia sp. TaxID=2023065 RepID=UPI002D55E6A6|nr:carotenoid oxygenase family protein [Stackebrandtia sp.]HZE37992.1 carotenoid oxygenase family protein [Stackebrandtia sp.]
MSFYMEGNYAPVHSEVTEFDLKITGQVPPELNGTYLRNGPNPRQESAHWFTGEGMIHGVRLEGSRARWYRNRWVRTHSTKVYAPDGSRDLTAGTANTHVVHHAGRTFALVESSLPVEITTELDTIGPYDFGGRLTDSMTAHPKICPETGELHFFSYGSVRPPYVTYHRADAEGNLLLSQPIDVGGHTMMHDFQLTAKHIVFMDLPVVFDHDRPGMPYRWSDTYPARLGVLRRDDPHGTVQWFSINPCYVFHGLNAHDTDGGIVIEVVRYPHLWRDGDTQPFPDSTLWRWSLDLAGGTVKEEQLDDRVCEFPRVDDAHAGQNVQFGHVVTDHELVRYDLWHNATTVHDFGAARRPAEASLVPGRDTDWLLTYVYDAATDGSTLEILDAGDLNAAPHATIQLPQRVPYGFHGNWIPAED